MMHFRLEYTWDESVSCSRQCDHADDLQDMHIDSAYVEIIGRVEEDLSVRALTSLSLGNNLGQLDQRHRR